MYNNARMLTRVAQIIIATHVEQLGLLMRPEHKETKAKTETRECKTKTETETETNLLRKLG